MKRWLSILLCICVATAVWAGGEAEATATDSEPLVNESGFPIVTRPITLDAVAIQQTWSRDWNDMPLFQAYEEQTGIRVEFTMIPQADRREKVNIMLIGPIGVRWFIDEDTGHYQNIDPPEGMNKNEHRAQHAPGSGGFAVGYYDRYGKITKPPYPEHMMLEEQTEIYLQYVPEESWPPNFIIPTPEESDFINQYEEEMLGYVWETMARFIFTDADIDNEWPDFVSQLERMRSDEILEIRQEQYDRYLSNF
jgi:hypothetical protein